VGSTKLPSTLNRSYLTFNHHVYTELFRICTNFLCIFNISYLLSNHSVYTELYRMYTKLPSIFNISYLLSNHSVYTESPSCHVGTPSDIDQLPLTPYLFAYPHYCCKFIHIEYAIKGVFNCYILRIRGSVTVMLALRVKRRVRSVFRVSECSVVGL
jgi:hypothetical protein